MLGKNFFLKNKKNIKRRWVAVEEARAGARGASAPDVLWTLPLGSPVCADGRAQLALAVGCCECFNNYKITSQ